MRYTVRPLGTWTGPATPPDRRRSARSFSAPWPATLDLLERETRLLGARLVVLQVDVRAGEIRRDGMIRADARGGHPGVRVAFDSHHGPLTYASDAYLHWQANTRAIALGLEALRAVDRYGISKSGEQYRGWAAIEAGPAMSAEQAARVLAQAAAGWWTAGDVLGSPAARKDAWRAAARRHHPDVAGDDPATAETYDRCRQAKELLDRLDELGLETA